MDLLVLVAPLLMAQAPNLQVGRPVAVVHQQLVQQGWRVSQEALAAKPLTARQRAIRQEVPALITCSGTGEGFCAYGYQRGRERLKLVSQGEGQLVRWQLGNAWFGAGVASR
ncbi:MAG: hypothetical protein VKJ87_06105 [Synechococcus sp.]|nr:hypothetical protein [Synechococcus sp.]